MSLTCSDPLFLLYLYMSKAFFQKVWIEEIFLIILVSKEKVSKYIKNERKLLVPYNGVSNGLLSCIRINYIKINDKIFKNVLLGLIDDKIYIDGADIILNNGMEDLCLEE